MSQTIHERPAIDTRDEAIARRAQIRAIATALIDAPRSGHRFDIAAGVVLQPSPRPRRHAAPPRPPTLERRRRPWLRRALAATVLLVQAGVLAALLAAPTFRVHTVDVSGERLLTRGAVLAAAHVPQSSLFTVDGAAIEARLSALPWVRSASVTTELPSTVRIEVTEWQPDLLWRHDAATSFVAGNGATLPAPAAESLRPGTPLLLDYRGGAAQPPIAGLAEILYSASQRWQSVFGCSVDAFVVSDSNVLSAWTSAGWEAVFGTVDSSTAVAALPSQLAVLAALAAKLDLAHPAIGYVDLENPTAPATGGHPGEPAALRAVIAGGALPNVAPAANGSPAPAAPSPTPQASAAPTPTPSPTPPPTPTPVVFSLAPPTPSGRG